MNKSLEKVAVTWARVLLKGTDYHVHFNPGKHPETRKKLNGAVSKNMDKYAL